MNFAKQSRIKLIETLKQEGILYLPDIIVENEFKVIAEK